MFILGHLGIGYQLVKPAKRNWPIGWILAGTLLPDLIDKPLYYGLSAWTGRHGAELGLISGTRTFGHTGIIFLILFLIGRWRRSSALVALAAGVATHLFLDNLGDLWAHGIHGADFLLALLWPVRGNRFPVHPFSNMHAHISAFGN